MLFCEYCDQEAELLDEDMLCLSCSFMLSECPEVFDEEIDTYDEY